MTDERSIKVTLQLPRDSAGSDEVLTAGEKRSGEIALEGVGVEHTVAVISPSARRLADLQLHGGDLEFALGCINEISRQSEDLVKEALWRCAVVHFFKCFGEAQRTSLAEKELYAPPRRNVLDDFDALRELRNRHYVHDESAWAVCVVAAGLDAGYRAKAVVALALEADHRESELPRLRELVEIALTWLTSERGRLNGQIIKELDALSPAQLKKIKPPRMPPVGAWSKWASARLH